MPANAEALPFEDASVDGYTIAFGIRNVTHIDRALSEAQRVRPLTGRVRRVVEQLRGAQHACA